MTGAAPEGHAGGFFGRRKGKALRDAQQARIDDLLPAARLANPWEAGFDPPNVFAFPVREVWLEIGFGGGEHLAQRAAENPDIGFIGCEPFVNGVVKLLAAIDEQGLRNVRIWDRDATELLPALPAGSIARVYLLYPDPWPKRRQRKRRFLGERNAGALARVMAPGAELRFATDIDDYAGSVLAAMLPRADFGWLAERADDWRVPWAGWQPTRYEAKARREGRASAYLTFRRAGPDGAVARATS